ncbi:MAG: hypothetical protein R3B52_01080 [Candidatus Paceibacterota bacterium]
MLKKILASFALFFFGISPIIGSAATYYDFSPDGWQNSRFDHSSATTVEQVFQTRHDIILQGVSLWVDNTGSGGSVTISVSNSLGQTLGSDTVSIGSIAESPEGTRIDAEFDDIEISNDSTYVLRISSSLPGLGIYFADTLFTFLTHNEAFISEFLLGKARIDGIDQDFTFKYALSGYPVGNESSSPSEEETPPATDVVINDAYVGSVGHNSATIYWTTNVASDSGLTARRQISPLYVVASAFDSTYEVSHGLTISGLTPNTLYFIDIFSTESSLGVSSFTIGLQTTSAPPADDPVDEEDPADDETPSDDPADDEGGGADEGEEVVVDDDGSFDYDFDEGDSEDSSPEPGLSVSKNGTVNVQFSSSGGSSHRIDVINKETGLLEQQYTLAPGDNSQDIPGLSDGEYSVAIYEEGENGLNRVAFGEFVLSFATNRSFGIYLIIGGAIVVSALGGFLIYKRKKLEKTGTA